MASLAGRARIFGGAMASGSGVPSSSRAASAVAASLAGGERGEVDLGLALEVFEDVRGHPEDEGLLALVDVAPGEVALGHRQGGDEHLVEDLGPRVLLEDAVDHARGAVLVHRQEPLVEPDAGVEVDLLPEERGEEAQARHVLAQDRQADRQRASRAAARCLPRARSRTSPRPAAPAPRPRSSCRRSSAPGSMFAASLEHAEEGDDLAAAWSSYRSVANEKSKGRANAVAAPGVGDEPERRRPGTPRAARKGRRSPRAPARRSARRSS